MSLSDPHWSPTSVQVTVLQARGLRAKGKSGTNDAYALMQVGKDKYQTSVAEKSVAPVWKEEAAFDLPQLQQPGGGGGGATLHVHVLHRALVGPDKLLGQAVINLLQLSQDKARDKTEWFKLLDKTGKADKDRGEVLVDIQFMRNNMTASMFDLSAAGKSRSRLGKFKDKVRGKKKESDSASTVVQSFPQVLTDSEEEEEKEEGQGNSEVAAGKGEKKKKKIKSLFSPKSNLQRNMSQSMSVLPAKNVSLSGSQSSGLNVDTSEGKKKFKFKIHKRSGSSDSKDSSSSLQKHAEQSNLCINGSHIYRDEPPRTSRIGSNFSLASSGHGSMEDVPESSLPSVDSLQAVRQYSPWTEEEEEETAEVEKMTEDEGERRGEEEEETAEKEVERRREAERLAEEKRTQERQRIQEEEEKQREEEERIRMEEERRRDEEQRLAEEKRRLEEEERRRFEEEKAKKEEEERIQREEEERRQEKEESARRKEEERKLAEEERRLEEEERRIEEEERIRREEEERRQEEEHKLAEEKRRLEEEERRRVEEESARKEEEGRIKMEEEKARKLEKERAWEERRRQEEEHISLAEEKMRLEEEEKRRAEEEKARNEEEEERIRREEEEKVEEERKRREEEHQEKMRLEEEQRRKREEEENARREKEERERLAREKRKLEEEEKKRIEEERRRTEEQEKFDKEKKILEEQERRRIEEEERARKEKDSLLEEKTRQEEQERKEERERIGREEAKKEKQTADEQKRTDNKTNVSSTNPFDEDDPSSADGGHSSSAAVSGVPQRRQPSVSSLTGRTSSSSEMDITGAQREKRPAPRPPGRSSAQGQSGRGGSAQHLAHNTKQSEDVRAVSVLPERSVQMIAPLSCSPTDAENIQSSAQSNTAKETISEGKHSKRQAPSRPGSVEDRPPTRPKMATGAETPSQGCSEVKREPTVHSINPFDEDEDELTVKADTAANAGSIQWPPAADKDVTSAAKIKPRKARAPTLPAQTTAASAGSHDSGVTMPDNSGRGSRDPKPQPVTVQNAAEKKQGPPATSRRLLPVKPLYAAGQPTVSIVQEVQEKTKVNGGALKGPYSQLTQAELISLVLKQENQLSERDRKISELELYIDNLLVRVMEEQPSILLSVKKCP